MSVKVVVAVGNRKIERCIARMEAIDVLTTVRKREAVLWRLSITIPMPIFFQGN